MSELCPCGSGETFEQCCGPLLSRQRPAPTAEALMRSRYTAYAKNDVDYLEKTILPRKRDFYNSQRTQAWNADVTWTGLRVMTTSAGGPDDVEGVVEFVASFEKAGQPAQEIHEVSRFRRKNGQWLYVDGYDGEAAETAPAPATPKVGRNDPCPCGSGKKYKRCCG